MIKLTKGEWLMTETKRDVLSEAMGFSKVAFGDNATDFFGKFEQSGFLLRFELNDGRLTLGCSGAELTLMMNSNLGNRHEAAEFRDKITLFDIIKPKEHWIGHALGYLQGRSKLTFTKIFELFPLESWYSMYILHEVGDETLWNKTLREHV